VKRKLLSLLVMMATAQLSAPASAQVTDAMIAKDATDTESV